MIWIKNVGMSGAARQLNVSRQCIYNWLNGRRTPPHLRNRVEWGSPSVRLSQPTSSICSYACLGVGQRLREAGDGQTGRSGAVGDRLNGFWGTETRAARAGGYLARQDLRKKPIYLRKEFPPCREPTPSGSLSRGRLPHWAGCAESRGRG